MPTWRRAIEFFRPDVWLIVLLVVLVGVSFGLSLIQPWIIPMFIDLVFINATYDDWIHQLFVSILPQQAPGRIIGLAVMAVVLRIGQEATWFLGRVMLNNRIRYNGLARVRLALYEKLQTLGLDYHRSRPQGDSIYRLNFDTQGFFGILDTLIGTSIACVTVTALVGIMLSRSVSLTLLALAAVPFLVLSNLYFAKEINRRSLIAKQAESDFLTTTQQSMGAIALIQAFWRQAEDFLRFKAAVYEANQANWRVNWMEALFPFSVQVIFGISTALIMGYGGYLAYRDQIARPVAGGITAGDLLAFMAYVLLLNDPLGRITGFRAAIQTNVAAAARVFVVIDTPVTVEDLLGAEPLPKAPRTLTLDGVSFRYPGTADSELLVLRNISARIDPGEFAAFVGSSGAGKSTLFALLPRFYDPISGSITLDGRDLRTIHLADVRKHIAAVQQDSPLFPGTIAENIAFARPEATREQVIAAAQAAGASPFIEAMAEQYDSEVKEGGQNLSGGQRQRLALARALLADAPILLLDEPTSAQDPLHAQGILRTLLSLRGRNGGRTVLLVTHDLGLVEQADRIFVLQKGEMVEEGKHEELMQNRGVYFDLHQVNKTDLDVER